MKASIPLEERVSDSSVLLLASAPGVAAVACLLEQGLGLTVETALDCTSCQELLRRQQFGLLLVEDAFSTEHPRDVDFICELASPALVLNLNFAVSNAARVLAQVRSALVHRQVEQRRMRQVMMYSVREEFLAALSGLLLQNQVLLSKAEADIAPLLEHSVCMIEALCKQLRA